MSRKALRWLVGDVVVFALLFGGGAIRSGLCSSALLPWRLLSGVDILIQRPAVRVRPDGSVIIESGPGEDLTIQGRGNDCVTLRSGSSSGTSVKMLAHYYLITDSDGSRSVVLLPDDDVSDFRKAKANEYKEMVKGWLVERKKWFLAVGKKAFPIARPEPPRTKKLSRVPVSATKQVEALEKHKRKLQVWNVCVVTDHAGDRTAMVLRRDKMNAQLQKMMKTYVEEIITLCEQRKTTPDLTIDKDDVPSRPTVKVAKSGLRSSELADKLAAKLNEKLKLLEEEKGDEPPGAAP